MIDPTAPPMQMPAKGPPRERLHLRVRPDGMVLTDRGVGAGVGAWLLIAPVGGLAVVFLITGIVGAVTAWSAPPGPANASSYRSAVDMAIGGFVLAFLLFVLLAILLRVFKIHRSFVVRVDADRREIVCRGKFLGWTTRRVELPFNHADWGVDAGYVRLPDRERSSSAGCIGALLLFALGPLGLIIALISNFSRKSEVKTVRGGTLEVVTLLLYEDDAVRAAVTIAEEATAERFLVAWDEMAQ